MSQHLAASEHFARAAEASVGVPFRLYGRDRRSGLDCVGLVANALGESGANIPPLPPYALRNSDYAFAERFVTRCGFVTVGRANPVRRGDLMMVMPGPAQRHLLVAAGCDRFIHAHAGLRRVVAVTLDLHAADSWLIAHHWRLTDPPTDHGD